jgi:hypothetical protein
MFEMHGTDWQSQCRVQNSYCRSLAHGRVAGGRACGRTRGSGSDNSAVNDALCSISVIGAFGFFVVNGALSSTFGEYFDSYGKFSCAGGKCRGCGNE